ncbi:MAG: PaaI family thioesterase [Cycloclasticus sp.]|nr:PaaI family thioesterase [Cycloclasticus sp.]
MTLTEQIKDLKSRCDYSSITDLVPYAKLIGIETSMVGDQLISGLKFLNSNIGNPALPALHGGVLAGFMETAALLHLIWENEPAKIPKVIDFSIDYLRPAVAASTYSNCSIVRLGNRVALCDIFIWQDDIKQPIAKARVHFLMSENLPIDN